MTMKSPSLLKVSGPFLLVAALALAGRPGAAQTWTEVATIAPAAKTGYCADLDGDTVVTGAPGHKGAGAPGYGAAFVHERDLGGKGAWDKRKKLLASVSGGEFGISVGISSDTIVVGAPLYTVGSGQGAFWIFERDLGGPDEWDEAAVAFASDGSGGERFGSSVDIWEDTAVAGAYLDDELGDGAGAAYVYQRDQGGQGAWGEVTKLTASDGSAGDGFGAVTIWKDTIAVGAAWAEGLRGAVYVFERNLGGPNGWGEAARITASDGVAGDQFGGVEMWEDTLVVSATGHNALGSQSGAAYVFERNQPSSAWLEQIKLIPSAGGYHDWFGSSVSLHGGTLAVSAPGAGAVFRFERDTTGPLPWVETQSVTHVASTFGLSVAVGPREAIITDYKVGEAYVYEDRTGTSYCTAGTSASGCRATLTALGTPSATAVTGFFLDTRDVEGDSKGIFFFGTNGRQANPWGNGTSFQCVVPPAKRGGILFEVGQPGTCDGSFTQDLNARWCPTCPKPHHNPGAGTVTQAQLWYRDRNSTSNQTTSLSDAIEFQVAP